MFVDISKMYLPADVINLDLYIKLTTEMQMPDVLRAPHEGSSWDG